MDRILLKVVLIGDSGPTSIEIAIGDLAALI